MNNSHEMREFAQILLNKTGSSSQRVHLLGHLSNYNDQTHSVRALVSDWQNGTNDYMETPDIQLAVPMSGFQYIPIAGATPDNLQGGEQVLIEVIGAANGFACAAYLLYNPVQLPPSFYLAQGTLDPMPPAPGNAVMARGEVLIYHETSGSMIRMFTNGDMQINAVGRMIVGQQNGSNITIAETGDVNVLAATATVEAAAVAVTVAGDTELTSDTVGVTATNVDIQAGVITLGTGAAPLPLCNSNTLALFNAHVHAVPGGGFTSAPTVLGVPGVDTTINTAAT